MMRAMVLHGCCPVEERPLKLAELPVPIPEDNQILVKISASGLCHTDIDEIEGRLTPTIWPIVLGHQVVGIVEQTGSKVTRFRNGQRVGITWLWWSCGRCGFCRSERENLCDDAKWTGKDANGGYAEYMVVPEDFAHLIPKEFSDAAAAPLLCAGVIGYRAVKLSEISDGQVVGLFGFGASAHIVIQVIRHRFPNNPVFVFTRSEEHRSLASSLGAAWTGRPEDSPPEMISRAIDFTPVGETIQNALAVLERGGRLVVNAIRKETFVPQLDYGEYLWLEKEIKSVANVTRQDAAEFLPLAAEIPIRPEIHEFELEQANEALIQLKQAKIRAAAVLNLNY
ncbi:MAG: zinc-dependent alcohol dehydrogenase family protein [Sedimentisphaerales bacterium]|nr:zinc-dependent alcohol dehydrogenase family protein [Sedimentisphaerales bacterium]